MFINKNNYNKQNLRIIARKIRAELDINAISKQIVSIIKQQDFYNKAQNILSFYPFDTEVDLRELYKDTSKTWFLPRCKTKSCEISIHRYSYGDLLEKNKYSVQEPISTEADPSQINLAIIPALMVDQNGYRLGYGSGYYDRFIPLLTPSCTKITPVPENMLIDKIITNCFDLPVDKAVTEKKVYDFC